MYKGRCAGRLLHFLRDYCGCRIADILIFEEGRITRCGKLFATYVWEGDSDFPIFEFVEEYKYFNFRQEEARKANRMDASNKATIVAKDLVDWDQKNNRRVALIHKEINDQLGAAEEHELQYLQRLADLRIQLFEAYGTGP